jgi:hypothetical protein
MLEILTPLNKVERVSRQIDPATFVAAPGIWAQVQSDGSLLNVLNTVKALVNKLVMGSASSNVYESHDIEVGRITTMESHGVRCKVDSAGYAGTITHGDFLLVSSDKASLGKLITLETAASTGVYEYVARCEEINNTAGTLIFRTISPVLVTKAP